MTDDDWLRLLRDAWRSLNDTLFGGGLRPAVLRLDDSHTRLGCWHRSQRSITLSRQLLQRPWPIVLEVLKHEMAHQYAHEVLRATEESAHGPAFRKVCAERGIDARAAGEPDAPDDKVLSRVRKLLALAESAEVHEAETAARMAHRLMLTHHLTEADLDARPFAIRHIGRASTRFMAHEKLLAGLLGKHFFVHCIYVLAVLPDGRRGRMLEICGRDRDVSVAAYVHDWLLATAERLYRDHRARGGGQRGRFLSGVVLGFADQLEQETRACEETGLVHVADAALSGFVRARHPHLGRGRAVALQADAAFAAGRRAGRRVRLQSAVSQRRPRLIEG